MLLLGVVVVLLPGAAVSEEEFVWGTSTAAYQVEGYRSRDGRSPSIWDAFDTANTSDVIKSTRPDGTERVEGSGAVADEDYERFEESADLTKELGFGAARLSISWPRVLTYSRENRTATVNEAGLRHYVKVIEAYAEKGTQVALTMFHWDLPLALEEYAFDTGCESAWLCDWMPEVFEEYASLLLSRLEATYWITLNEPLTIVSNGYSGNGGHAPGRCASANRCYEGDSTEAFSAAKTMILAHARAFRVWESMGRPGKGCGITLNGDYRVAFTEDDLEAAERDLEWQLPLFFDPIFYGRWPESAQKWMPKWTQKELKIVHGSHDGKHLFTNSYTTYFVRRKETGQKCQDFPCSKSESSGYNFTSGDPIGVPSTNGWLFDYGLGIRYLLNWYDARYPNRTFVITENGWGNKTRDDQRCSYYRDYISNVSAASILDGVDVAAYFAWSLLDNYEWADAYQTRFGIVHVDFATQKRSPKPSALWFKSHVTGTTSLNQTLELPACQREQDRKQHHQDHAEKESSSAGGSPPPRLQARYLIMPTLAVASILYVICTLAGRQIAFACRFFAILTRRCFSRGKVCDATSSRTRTTSLPKPRKKSGGRYYRKLSPEVSSFPDDEHEDLV